MAKKPAKVEVKKEEKAAPAAPAISGALAPLQTLRDEVDRLFEEFTRGFGFGAWPSLRWPRRLFEFEPFRGLEITPTLPVITPRVDIAENDKELTITAELPGMDEKDVQVVLTDDVLSIKGEKKLEKEDKQKDYYRMERSYGAFERSFRLPDYVDRDKIEASYENGVLKITAAKIPGKAKPAGKKIEIKAK